MIPGAATGKRRAGWAATISALAAAGVGLALWAAPAQAAPWWMRWGRGPHGYDPNTVVTLEATVRVPKLTPPMPSMEVETALGEAVSVVLGPPWYLERAGVAFAAGDRVIVEGSKLMEDSGRVVLVAARVEKVPGGATLRLRNEQGMPLWMPMGGRQGPPMR
jgi:hypothetical protein